VEPVDEKSFHLLFRESSVALGATAKTREEVLALLVDAAVAGGGVDAGKRDKVYEAVLARESLGSTGIGGGIAIPHAKTDHVDGVVTSILVIGAGIDFKAVDGESCDVFFLLLSPKSQHEMHLAILRWLSRMKRNPDFAPFLRRSRSPRDVVALLEEMGG
jgi:mannitol/fructose-specific phosphotransferase system IIA component (Ntr-type)